MDLRIDEFFDFSGWDESLKNLMTIKYPTLELPALIGQIRVWI